MIFEIIDQFKSGFKKIDLFEFELLTFTQFQINAPSKAPDVSKINTSGLSGRNNVANSSMNQPSVMNSVPGNQANNGMMRNNTPIEPVEDEQQQSTPMMTVEMEKMFESSNWKMKFLLSE